MVNWVKGVRGLGVRLLCSVTLAIVASVGTVSPWPRWTQSVVFALHTPLAVVWYRAFPSQDSYSLYEPSVGFNFIFFVTFATTVYLVMSYLPNIAFAMWRTTRDALRAPATFAAYAVVGAVIGALVGLAWWASFISDPTRAAMHQSVACASFILGWCAAVLRASFERRLHGEAP
jgi:hypothetical protein